MPTTSASTTTTNSQDITDSLQELQKWLSSSENLKRRVQEDIVYAKNLIKQEEGLNFGEYYELGGQKFSLNSDHPVAQYKRSIVTGTITTGNNKISSCLNQGLKLCNKIMDKAKTAGTGIALCEDPAKALACMNRLNLSPRDLQEDPSTLVILAWATALNVADRIKEQMEASISHSSPQRLAERVEEVNTALNPLQKMVDHSRLISGIATANLALQVSSQRLTNLSQVPPLDKREPVAPGLTPVPQFLQAA